MIAALVAITSSNAAAASVARVVATLARDGLPYTVGQPTRVDGGVLIPKF
jgi:hypothetical protein